MGFLVSFFSFFHQASEQAAQSVGSFIRRPMQLPPPTQVGHGVQTPGISRASAALSAVLSQFDQEPAPVQPQRASVIMGGSDDLSHSVVGDAAGVTGPGPDTQAHLAQKAGQVNSTQVESPRAHISDISPPPNGQQRLEMGENMAPTPANVDFLMGCDVMDAFGRGTTVDRGAKRVIFPSERLSIPLETIQSNLSRVSTAPLRVLATCSGCNFVYCTNDA